MSTKLTEFDSKLATKTEQDLLMQLNVRLATEID